MNIATITTNDIEQVIDNVAAGMPVNDALVLAGHGKNTMLKRIRADPALLARYFDARVLASHIGIDEIVSIADTEPDPNRARVRIEARVKHAEKVAPRIYGPKLDVTIDERPSIRAAMQLALARIGQGPARDRDLVVDTVTRDGTTFEALGPTDTTSDADELARLMGGE